MRDTRWSECAVPIAELADYAAAYRGVSDVFVTQQSFFGWRRLVSQLAQLGALYADLDYYHRKTWAGASPEHVCDALLHSLQDWCLPAPSYVLASGRGLLATWLHDLVPRAALPRWAAAQKELCRKLAPFGADRGAIDAARVFRLSGTHHSRADAIVRPVWMAASSGSMWRWSFDDLLGEILPLGREELQALRVRRLASQAQGLDKTPAFRLDTATYCETVLEDLQKLRRLRWFGGLPPGQRDSWLLLACTAMSWLVPAWSFPREARALAAEVAGWDQRETDSRMAAVFARAQQALKGRTIEWNGHLVDPRYRYSAATMIELLEITPQEMRDADLRVLVDRDVARERAAERQRQHRRRSGVRPRAEYEALAARRAQEAQALRASGKSWAKVAECMQLRSPDAARHLSNRTGPSR